MSQIETHTTIVVQLDYKGKKNLQRRGGNVYHPQKCNGTILAQLGQEKSTVRQNAVVVSSMVSKKTANLANILFLLFLVDCHSVSFESQPRSIKMETTNK